jgi:hypothetical protein
MVGWMDVKAVQRIDCSNQKCQKLNIYALGVLSKNFHKNINWLFSKYARLKKRMLNFQKNSSFVKNCFCTEEKYF